MAYKEFAFINSEKCEILKSYSIKW